MKGICFIEPLFHATIEGRKTQTRRIVKPQPLCLDGVSGGIEIGKPIHKVTGEFIKPRYKVGETVYIREPFCQDCNFRESEHAKEWIANMKILYKYAGDEISELAKGSLNFGKWISPRFMPAEYARYFIKITAVRCERLQDISDSDCLKEGIYEREKWSLGKYYQYDWNGEIFQTPQEAYAALIDKINGKGTWESNPYVWVYDYELVSDVPNITKIHDIPEQSTKPCCSTCANFSDEDISGLGYCSIHGCECKCSKCCMLYLNKDDNNETKN